MSIRVHPWLPSALPPKSKIPLHRQVYNLLRRAILDGQLPAAFRLPSTRTLASELKVSRNTILDAVAQLAAEGYLHGRHGSGTFVSHSLPDELLTTSPSRIARNAARTATLSARRPRSELSRRGSAIASAPQMPYHPGCTYSPHFLPRYLDFPRKLWGRLVARHSRNLSPRLFYYGDFAGYLPLRQAIAAYLAVARGVRCSPEQIIITTGSQQALDLAARLLLDPADPVWLEDPGYLGARGALLAAGAKIIPVPLDAQGLNLDYALRKSPRARLAFVTPSHQFPLGVTMSLPRRLALLEWARRNRSWIIEDDYDSEFRYTSRPLASLQSLDQNNRVIYTGTFSKILFPSLRIGYLIAPPALIPAFSNARWVTDVQSSLLTQAVLADFISEGHLSRHVRRMRALYAQRQQILLSAAREHLADILHVCPADAGMHLVGSLPQSADDIALSARAARRRIYIIPLSPFYLARPARKALLLGYTGTPTDQIPSRIRQLAAALKTEPRSHTGRTFSGIR